MSIPLGAKLTENGVHFSLFSAHAERVELCLFESVESGSGTQYQATQQLELVPDTFGVWSREVPGVTAGIAYGYRVHGPFAPQEGHLYNPNKLLFCPYAQSVARLGSWDQSLMAFSQDPQTGRYALSESDSEKFAPLAAVARPLAPYTGARPEVSRDKLVIYELHVKGMTALHPLVPEHLRGTYLGLAHPAVPKYLAGLGITAVELLPIHFHFDEPHVASRGLTNYWGYSTLGYFAPDPRYASDKHPDAANEEFRQMVSAFHKAGIEVILDVVFNHSCEGGPGGPTVCFRGIDNASYYRLDPKSRDRYVDYTGCGNSLDTRHPRVIELIMASLRHWVEIMGVDGFRFDLAPVLGRGRFDMDPEHGLFQVMAQDRVLSKAKLLAEPWDLGTYQLGHFLGPWMEWNGQYRDTLRSYWRGEPSLASRLATRLAGSSDLFANRGPLAGINFITCHDGFTLRDLVSYERKYNEANGEDNRDGSNENRSWNCGHEGETGSKEILALRLRQQKNFLFTLCFSAGVPMILGGDEISRTQKGNNNTYCQDNELSWLDWQSVDASKDLRPFLKKLLKIRAANPTLRRATFFSGQTVDGEIDLSWWSAAGTPIEPEDWVGKEISAFAALYGRVKVGGEQQEHRLLLCLNPTAKNQNFLLSEELHVQGWKVLLSTSERKPTIRKCSVPVQAHSLVLLQSA